ncbi:MAG TPA: hypothetical protein VF658_17060 [Pyrinomonadaceae bacterium]|jgi:hypothetical protein
MKTTPRNFNRFAFFVLLALALPFVFLNAQAQQRGRSRTRPTAKTQAQEAERVQRAEALTLLSETADDARALDDLFYRARLQALAADALWPHDRQRARATFRHAWEAATASDKAEQEAYAQEIGALPDSVEQVTEARDEVLSKTAARDAALADIFLRDLHKGRKAESALEENEPEPATTWRAPSAMGARRIALALEMLDKGDAESAFRIVKPIVNEGLSASLMTFMLQLHRQNAAFGDALYRLLITQASREARADANTVLLLSTPIVSPELMVAVNEYGSLQFRPIARAAWQFSSPPPLSSATRNAFFSTAANILLRPATLRAGISETQDKAARYFAIGRLLPFFERDAAQYAPELQALAGALLNELTESHRASLSSQLNLHTIGPPPSNDPLRSHFEELSRTSEQAERDRITIRIIQTAASNHIWDRARRAAAELSDEGTRRAANSFIAVNQIADISYTYADEKEDDYESIVAFLKSVDVPPLAAAWGYAQAAVVAARKKDRQRVAELLTEAEHYTERADVSTGHRVAAYVVIAMHAARVDRQRAWELLTQLVRAANQLEDYAGDEVSLEIRADENSESESPFILTTKLFRLDAIFATMAQLDFERALTSARALEGDVPRLFAQLAIARAIMEKQNSESRIQKPE